MCHRKNMWGFGVFTLGLGFVLSCLIGSWFLRLIIGIVLIIVGATLQNKR